jgi:uncharacterized phage protein gp47/JayE
VSLNLSSLETIVKRIRADVTRYLPDLDPTIYGSFIRAITDSNAGRHYDNILSIKQLELELFPNEKSSTESMDRWATFEGITRFTSQQSSGYVILVGTVAISVPVGATLRDVNGNVFNSTAIATVSAISEVITLQRSGTTVTATALTATDLNLATNMDVVISAVPAEFAGTYQITVLSPNSFSYEAAGASSSGIGSVTANAAYVPITSDEFGLDKNLASGAQLTLIQAISGINSEGYVDSVGLTGGQDAESNIELLVRIIQTRSNPVTNFNVGRIERTVLGIQGNTRVKVNRVTPAVGSVTILFVRDNDPDIIPDLAARTAVKAAIVEYLPATTEESGVVVPALVAVPTEYDFQTISPDSISMRAAITTSLEAFYQDGVTFETDIVEEKYKSAIINTLDTETGQKLVSFTLNAPIGDISITTGEIGTIDQVIFQ